MIVPAEPLDLIPLTLRNVSNQMIFGVIQFSFHIDLERLAESVEAIYRRFPLTRSNLIISHNRVHWQPLAPPEVLVIEDTSICKLIQRTVANQKCCALRFWIVREQHRDTLCIGVDHVLADAAGVRGICYLLAGTYTDNIDTAIRNTGITPAQNRSLSNIYAMPGARELLQSFLLNRIPAMNWHLDIATQLDRIDSTYEIRQVNGCSLNNLKYFGKNKDATINDVLLSAFYCALAREANEYPFRTRSLQFTVDLRRFLNQQNDARLANLSGTASITLQPNTPIELKTVLAEITHQTCRIKENWPGISTALVARCLFCMGYRQGAQVFLNLIKTAGNSGKILPVLSNLGFLQADKLVFGSSRPNTASLIGPNLTIPGIMLCASGFKDELSLSVGYNRYAISKTQICRVLDRIQNYLKVAAQSKM